MINHIPVAVMEIIERLFISTATALMINLCSHFPAKADIDASLYWEQKMAEFQQLDNETIKIITDGTAAAPGTMRQAIFHIVNEDLKGIVPKGKNFTPFNLQRTLEALAVQADNAFNLVNTNMRYAVMNNYFTGINVAMAELNRASIAAVSGQSARRASLAAVRRCLDNGITGFRDSAGRNWTPEAYINMVTRSTLHNTQVQGRFSAMADMDEHVFQVSSHAGARPGCAPYQGKFYSTNNTSGIVHDLDGMPYPFEPLQNTSYGDPAGLFGINCGHFPIPFYDGLSRSHAESINTEAEEKANAEQYERFQAMRAQERDIRELRTEESALRASGNLDQAAEVKAKVTEKANNYKAWCEDHGMTPRMNRTTIAERRANDLQP